MTKCQLVKGLPEEVYKTEWDTIIVDAPTEFPSAHQGRLRRIHGKRKEGETHIIIVHDVNRVLEENS